MSEKSKAINNKFAKMHGRGRSPEVAKHAESVVRASCEQQDLEEKKSEEKKPEAQKDDTVVEEHRAGIITPTQLVFGELDEGPLPPEDISPAEEFPPPEDVDVESSPAVLAPPMMAAPPLSDFVASPRRSTLTAYHPEEDSKPAASSSPPSVLPRTPQGKSCSDSDDGDDEEQPPPVEPVAAKTRASHQRSSHLTSTSLSGEPSHSKGLSAPKKKRGPGRPRGSKNKANTDGQSDVWHRCDQDGCDYKTKRKDDLRRHKANVHDIGVQWHFCDQCDYKAKEKGNLKVHKRNVHGITAPKMAEEDSSNQEENIVPPEDSDFDDSDGPETLESDSEGLQVNSTVDDLSNLEDILTQIAISQSLGIEDETDKRVAEVSDHFGLDVALKRSLKEK
ncbi:hypothetical protein TrVE_jg1921 [Triparma verrucosa]|uniref:C2H2-type domain-containing protein n=1 Tax=Triparma verrucosa TaxID=1606542 RepID=A0A9W7CL68_9STRA|nr:hypothetical protein TrVE_jg1921 [Triparma verrucosa]